MLLKCCRAATFPSRIYKSTWAWALFLLALLFPLNSGAQEQRSLPAASPGLTETLSGLKLGQSTVHDIQSKLGPTLMFKNDPDITTRRMCYVSDKDYTLISFTTERNVITRLQVFSDKHRYDRWDWCTATPMSADDWTLTNEITLGSRPEDIVSILGKAHKTIRDKWQYAYCLNWQQPQTQKNKSKTVAPRMAFLELEFTNSELIHFDIRTYDCRDANRPIRP